MDTDNQAEWIQSAITAIEAEAKMRQEARKVLTRERWKLVAKCAVVIVAILCLSVYVTLSFLAQHIQYFM